MSDQREELYNLRSELARKYSNGIDRTDLDVIRLQLLELEAKGVKVTGIAISMDILMGREVQANLVVCHYGMVAYSTLLGRVLKIIGDASNTIAFEVE